MHSILFFSVSLFRMEIAKIDSWDKTLFDIEIKR